MTERAARWVRVSSDGQDEANQYAEVDAHITARGYDVARTFALHDVSASKGEQAAALDEALGDIKAGRYSVIVVAHSSRLDRRDVDVAEFYALSVRMAGGRVESAREPAFGQTDIGGRVLTLLAQHANHEYSQTLKGHTRAGLDRVRANGALASRTPWGFTSEGAKYNRRLVPTDTAREYIPQAYRRVIAGQSLAQVCRWLESEGVAPAGIAKDRADGRGKGGQWWPRTLGQLIRNPVYMGLKADGSGQTVTTCEALVDAATWAQAGQALDSRPRRGPVLKADRCALSGATRCHACGGPLYRIRAGNGNTHTYLRCSGTGAARKSCGAPMIRLDAAEALADDVLGALPAPIFAVTLVPGNEAEIDARLAALDYERKQVALRGLSWDEEDAERARIREQYEQVQAMPRIPAERRATATGQTYGSMWAGLDTDGRAAWLRSGEVTVAFARGEVEGADGTRDGVSLVLLWNEDD